MEAMYCLFRQVVPVPSTDSTAWAWHSVCSGSQGHIMLLCTKRGWADLLLMNALLLVVNDSSINCLQVLDNLTGLVYFGLLGSALKGVCRVKSGYRCWFCRWSDCHSEETKTFTWWQSWGDAKGTGKASNDKAWACESSTLIIDFRWSSFGLGWVRWW